MLWKSFSISKILNLFLDVGALKFVRAFKVVVFFVNFLYSFCKFLVYLFLNQIVAAFFPIGVLGLIPSTTVLSVRFERIGFRKTRIAIPLILTEYIDLICILELSFGFNQPLKISTFFEVKPKKSFQKNTQNAQPCLPPWAWRQNELWQTQGSSSEERMVAFILSLDQSDTYKRILTSFELKNWVLIQLNCGFFICSKSRSNRIL